jgi:periplasmic divalent cation tolerance protein
MSFLVFYITHPDEATAKKVTDRLLEQRLVACANIFPITSAYWWERALQRAGEWVSLVKTRPELEERVVEAVEAIHPYEVPCIMRFEVRANAAYEAWIRAETEQSLP